MRHVLVLVIVAACGGRSPGAVSPALDPEVRITLDQAEAAERARHHDEARVHYERAIAIARDPTSIAQARRDFAETLVTWGAYAEARTHLEVAVAADARDPAAWHDLGLLRHQLADHPGAVAALERARTLAPADPRPRTSLAALRWKLGDRAGAAAEYRAMLELDLPARQRAKVEWALDELAKAVPPRDVPKRGSEGHRPAGEPPTTAPYSTR